MSFGFLRMRSPAARSQSIQKSGADRYRRVTQIKGLSIDEVSSVDRGAGENVRVVLIKSSNEREQVMSTGTTIFEKCAHAIAAAGRGETTADKFASLFEIAANASFPLAKSTGQAMGQFLATPLGAEMIRANLELEKRGLAHAAQPDADELARIAADRARALRGAQDDDDDDDKIDAMAREHRKTNKALSHAQCVAHVLSTPEGTAAYQKEKSQRMNRVARVAAAGGGEG